MTALSVAFFAKSQNTETSLLMRNVEALAFDEGGSGSYSRVRSATTTEETIKVYNTNGYLTETCKALVTVVECAGIGTVPCAQGIYIGETYDCVPVHHAR